MVNERAKVLVLAGSTIGSLQSALDLLPLRSDGNVVIAVADRHLLDGPCDTARRLAGELERRGSTVSAIAPSRTTAGAWMRSRSTDWSNVDVGHRARRLDQVVLPSALIAATSIVAVNELPERSTGKEPIAIGIWARFAHPRQRLGARLSNPRDGLTAEIALAVDPALVLLFATSNDIPILIASDDQIAAELAGLAIRQRLQDPDVEPIGPWEDPLVQRATELGLGITTPSEIDVDVRWQGGSDDPAEAAFRAFAGEILARIGVKSDG